MGKLTKPRRRDNLNEHWASCHLRGQESVWRCRRVGMLPVKRKHRGVPRNVSVAPDPGFRCVRDAGLWGIGAKVAVIDTGCKIGSEVRRGIQPQHLKDFTVPNGTCDDTTVIQHGTVVASLIKVYAPGAQLLCAKVGVEPDALNVARVVQALEWAYKAGANVINLSSAWPISGCMRGGCPLCHQVEALARLGVVVVVAAANKQPGLDTIRCPGVSEHAFTIGAVGTDGTVAEYSVRAIPGRLKPDLLAPGTVVFSGAAPLVGTSFAAPVASAAVAVLGATSGRYVEAVDALKRTARPVPDTPEHPAGRGLINLPKVLEVWHGAGAASDSSGQG